MESRYLKAEEKAGKISEAMPKSLLLVEDDDKHAELIRKAFRESKSEWNIYRVATLKAALEWLQEAETKPPFVVVAGYRLPDGTGLDIAGEAKSPEELGFPLIILTGQGSEQLAVRSFKSGAMDYMVKQTEWLQELPWTVEHVLREWDTITERKAAVEALQESEERFRMMFENMSNAVAVYEVIDEGRDFIFKDFNQSAEKLEDMKRKDLIGKSLLDVFSRAVDFGLLDVFQRVWRTGNPEHHPISLYNDERIVGFRENYVYKLPSGEIVAIYEDVTKRKRRAVECGDCAEDGIIVA